MSNFQEIHKRSFERRREAQYNKILEWEAGRITGDECIQCIIDLEKFIPVDSQIIHGEQKQEQKDE